MTRGSFLTALLAPLAGAFPLKRRQKYYITGGTHLNSRHNDCTVSPLVSYGTSKEDALLMAGLTIWPAHQFEETFAKGGANWKEICVKGKKLNTL